MSSADHEHYNGEEPSPDHLFYVDWADQLAKDAVPFVNGVLRQMVTLSSAFFAGGVALYNQARPVVFPEVAVAAMVLMLLSLASAVWGMFPYPYRDVMVRNQYPDEVRRVIEGGLRVKRAALALSGGCFLLGLVVVFVGIISRHP